MRLSVAEGVVCVWAICGVYDGIEALRMAAGSECQPMLPFMMMRDAVVAVGLNETSCSASRP
jgi:hypothetical protein